MKSPLPRKTVNGFELSADPAREACFTVADTDDGMANFEDGSPTARREKLHRHMNNEIGSLEIAAQCLADFPDAPWELRMQLARQAYDESRHVTGLKRRLLELGGRKGEFPIGNFEWSVTTMQDSLAARLAIQNRTFEAGQMDLLGGLRTIWRSLGDDVTADLLETILADEISHVRFANRWIKIMARQNGRTLLEVAKAMQFLADANAACSPPIAGKAAAIKVNFDNHARMEVNREDRRLAEFTEDEINEILRQTGLGSLSTDQANY